jgi:hypothetical protein
MSYLREENCWYIKTWKLNTAGARFYTGTPGPLVYTYYKHEAGASMPVYDVAKAQERTAQACDFNIEIVQRIISEGNVANVISLSLSPRHPPSFVLVTLVSYGT